MLELHKEILHAVADGKRIEGTAQKNNPNSWLILATTTVLEIIKNDERYIALRVAKEKITLPELPQPSKKGEFAIFVQLDLPKGSSVSSRYIRFENELDRDSFYQKLTSVIPT